MCGVEDVGIMGEKTLDGLRNIIQGIEKPSIIKYIQQVEHP